MMTIATQFGASAFTQHCCALRRLRQAPRRWAATPVALSPEQQQYAMEKQLRLSQEREAAAVERKTAQAAAQAAAAADAEAPTPGRKPTRRELRGARRAAAKEAEAAAQQQSAAAQSELAARLGPLDEHALSSALRVQLRQSGTFDEADVGEAGEVEDEAAGAATGANHGAHPLPAGSRAAAVFEDGCLLYTSDSLGASGVEETLTA